MRIAFYAPLKSPNHPIPSGDRKIARLFMAALRQAGHEVSLASELRTWSARPTEERRNELISQSADEVESLHEGWRAGTEPLPDLWFTYHPYYKAPDWIGPEIARRLSIPYVTAEASYAAKRDRDDWAAWQAAVADALELSALNICMTSVDSEALIELVGAERIAELHPFIDTTEIPAATPIVMPGGFSPERPLLVTVAMMRPGDKLESYKMLAQVLDTMVDLPWSLLIVGNGTQRAAVEQAFSSLPPHRIAFCGEARPEEVAGYLAEGDVYVWPGYGEAYGLSYLEAQLAGLPVVAQRSGGISSVVSDNRTGLLTPEGDHAAFAIALTELINDEGMRMQFGKAASAFVKQERTLAAASVRLNRLLNDVIKH